MHSFCYTQIIILINDQLIILTTCQLAAFPAPPPPTRRGLVSTQPSLRGEQGIGIEKEPLNHSIYIYCQSQAFRNNFNSSISIPIHCIKERPGTHCLRMREIFRHIFHKKFRTLTFSICGRFY